MESLGVVLVACSLIHLTNAHGFLADPPGRSSVWTKNIPGAVVNNDHNALRCGGVHLTRTGYEEKCGVCGDGLGKLENEPGKDNKYAQGIIVASYTQGQAIDVTVHLTAFHRGVFEFRLCANDIPQKGLDRSIAVNYTCFSANRLKSSVSGNNTFVAKKGIHTYPVQLPNDVVCKACVLQWRYYTNNAWKTEMVDGVRKSGIQYGEQENFFGCADISIVARDDSNISISTISHTTADTQSTIKSRTPRITESRTTTTTRPTKIAHSTKKTLTTKTNQPTTKASSTTEYIPTESIGDWENGDGDAKECLSLLAVVSDDWCSTNCNHVPPYCPPYLCNCGDKIEASLKTCYSTRSDVPNDWCSTNCNHLPPNCPSYFCSCDN